MDSSNALPATWRPIGRPAELNPQGTEIAGRPVRVIGELIIRSSGSLEEIVRAIHSPTRLLSRIPSQKQKPSHNIGFCGPRMRQLGCFAPYAGPKLLQPKGPQFSDSRSRKILVYDQANLTAIQGELSVPKVRLQRDVDFGLVICGLGNVVHG